MDSLFSDMIHFNDDIIGWDVSEVKVNDRDVSSRKKFQPIAERIERQNGD